MLMASVRQDWGKRQAERPDLLLMIKEGAWFSEKAEPSALVLFFALFM